MEWELKQEIIQTLRSIRVYYELQATLTAATLQMESGVLPEEPPSYTCPQCGRVTVQGQLPPDKSVHEPDCPMKGW